MCIHITVFIKISHFRVINLNDRITRWQMTGWLRIKKKLKIHVPNFLLLGINTRHFCVNHTEMKVFWICVLKQNSKSKRLHSTPLLFIHMRQHKPRYNPYTCTGIYHYMYMYNKHFKRTAFYSESISEKNKLYIFSLKAMPHGLLNIEAES